EKGKQIEEYRTKKNQNEVTKSSGGFAANVLTRPNIDPVPISPKLTQSLMLGMAAGLFIGLGLATLAELADKSFRSPLEIRQRLGLPVIGHIPPIRVEMDNDTNEHDFESSLVTAVRPKSIEAEAYRGVRTALYFSAAGRGHQVIQVTSPNPGDGKSTLAANLAVSIAQSGKRVILVDCDFRRPRMHKIFHINEPGPGFVGILMGEATLAEAVKRCSIENLALLPCGTRPTNPSELLSRPEFVSLVEQAQKEYDFVILDTPPLLAVSDPSAVATRADGVILVFRMTNRARPQAERAREQLAQLGANVLGVVVNGAGRAADGYGYGSGAGYHYDYEYEYADKYNDDGSIDDLNYAPPKKG
ncbi:MAG: polysaccharide biosynthesis tyrosine autokinase, partial [Gemmataceae bacterium]